MFFKTNHKLFSISAILIMLITTVVESSFHNINKNDNKQNIELSKKDLKNEKQINIPYYKKNLTEDELIILIKNKQQIICHAENARYNFAGNWDIDERDKLFCNYQKFLADEEKDLYKDETVNNIEDFMESNDNYIEFIENQQEDEVLQEENYWNLQEGEGNYIEFIQH